MSAEDICKWPSGHFIDRALLLDWGAPYMVARPPISWRPMVGNKALYRRHPNTNQQREKERDKSLMLSSGNIIAQEVDWVCSIKENPRWIGWRFLMPSICDLKFVKQTFRERLKK